MSEKFIKNAIVAASKAINAHSEELTALDQAIGDGDHGINMKRGFDALVETADEIAVLPFDQALQKAGMTLVMKIGGASGPLYGSLLMAMGRAAVDAPTNARDVGRMLVVGVEAVKARGRSDVGAKTMLEVLAPVAAALSEGSDIGLDTIREAAARGLAATKDMKATKGRASFLGERSIGHLDPGARSSEILVNVICDILEVV